ncbi:MAG: translational GTPase TypA [Deltaproteobacteria bacterium]|nr:translational GTPase TypA [Deltaproteobacteria bacterium]
MHPQDKLRNIAIVAHVDHGKTTLVDMMLRQSGTFRDNEEMVDRVMDSNDLERERGITILAKNTSVRWGDYKINVIDTPGHADFGGEVERTLMMADAALLLVDAAEGPLPQTRFVLRKALERGFPVIVVINKIDRQDARPDDVVSEVFDLFCDLEASDKQADFPVLYAIGKLGICRTNLTDTNTDLKPLFEKIVEYVPASTGNPDASLQVLVTSVDHDDYVGRLAIGRVVNGTVRENERVKLITENGSKDVKIVTMFSFEGLQRKRATSIGAGESIAIAGIEDVNIGDTIADINNPVALPRIHVDEPTIKMRVGVNTSPFAGKDGKYLTSRQIRERLHRAVLRNPAMRVEDTESPDQFLVYGRGELALAILAETMRREGYELSLGNPEVVTRVVDGKLCEPVEMVICDIPDNYIGVVTQRLGERRGIMVNQSNPGLGRVRVEFEVPSRGLIGFRSEFLSATRGMGLINTQFHGWQPSAGPKMRRANGAIVSDRMGETTPYALFHLQPRGSFFCSPSTPVYEGMIVGEHNRPNDTDVNIVREKKLSNVRMAGKDDNTILHSPKLLTIETAMEWIDEDELVEVTPKSVRVRKKILGINVRPKRNVGED